MTNPVLKKSWLIKRITLIAVFLVITPITLSLTVFSLLTLNKNYHEGTSSFTRSFFAPQTKSLILAPFGISSDKSVSDEVISGDSRAELLRKYLTKNKSPLLPHAEFIVALSDKYMIDYRLLVAIAQKESGLCRVIPEGSHNCWGWGIHSKGSLGFDSYEEGLETVAKGLKEKYVDKGYLTVEQIMTKYAHSSSTTWAEGVIGYMNDIQ